MKKNSRLEKGFTLIFTMLILLVLTILVLAAVRQSTLNEKMSGNYMDRNRAQQAAEQAIQQAKALLVANGETCLSGCQFSSSGVATSSSTPLNAIPTSWTGVNAIPMTLYAGQTTSGTYKIDLLASSFLPAAKNSCIPYSITGRGQGIDSRSVVVLQTVAFVCPVD